MTRYGLILASAVAMTGCGVLDPTPGPEPASPGAVPIGAGAGPVTPGALPAGGAGAGPAVGEGEALFIRYCAVCHGADGSGAGPFPESIRGATGMHDVVVNGVGEMPAFPQLTAQDVLAMERYLAGAAPAPGQGGGAAPQGPLSARDVFAFQCAACHGEQGEGARLGPQIRSPSAGYFAWVTRNGREGVGYDSPMPGYDTQVLSDAHLDELIGWLGSFPKPSDGGGLFARFCANCHGPTGGGGPVRSNIRGDDLGDFREAIRDGEGGRRYGRRGDYMPRWTRSQITDAEIEAMYRFVRGGGAPSGGGDEDDD